MSDLYRVACVFERTRIAAHLDHVDHAGCWRVVDCWRLGGESNHPILYSKVNVTALFIVAQKSFKKGSYISPKKELRPYITPKGNHESNH